MQPGGRDEQSLGERIAALSAALEKASLAEYVELMRRPLRTLWLNFLAGVARGFGMAVGFTILGAIVVYLLQSAFVASLPAIGSVLADLVRIIQLELRTR